MKAAVIHHLGQPFTLEDRPVPQPSADQVLVRMEASGLCHTDIHAARGDWPVQPTPPFVPGHEGVGIIERVGDHVTTHRVGDRVAIAWLGRACGDCRYCLDGREALCEHQVNSGYSIDGALAEYAVADGRYAVAVPAGIEPFEAAPLTCAGVTSYKSVKVAHVQPGELVAVFGIGGLGHLAVQYARLVGARVVAIDVNDDKLELATSLGADHVVNASTTDPVRAVTELGGADVALAYAVAVASFEQAFGSLNRGGRLVCVALPADGVMAIPIFDTVLKGIEIIGSIVGTRQDLREVLDLHARGRTRVVAEPRKLDQVNLAVAELLRGDVPARLVFEF
ncbi:MAG: zinc-dependent alcohol dehydrogenase [Aeromicrobium sp.]|nr:zinc-dependent alcohol dehydrogenase [Aeromicrobium sp.]